MATLLERIQAALALCPDATGDVQGSHHISGASKVTVYCGFSNADVKEIVTALSAKPLPVTHVVVNRDREVTDLRHMLADAREQVTRLTNTNAELQAAVAQMTSGVPDFCAIVHESGAPVFFGTKAQCDVEARHFVYSTVVPLFRATHTPRDVAELAAKVGALGIELAREKRMREETRLDLVKMATDRDEWKACAETYASANIEVRGQRDALQARVDTLTAGERLTKDALAAAEKRAERAEFDRDNAVSGRTSAQHLLKAAEARVKVLEGSGEPVGWFSDHHRGYTFCPNKGFNTHPGEGFEPLYRHPPKSTPDVVVGVDFAVPSKRYPAWETSGGPNECPHGYAEGIPCERCDKATPKPAGEPVASVGYVVQRRAQGGAWWNYNTLYSDLDGVDRFIKSSLGYWDRDEGRILEVVAVRSRMAIAGGKPNAFVDGKWTPLYEAPPPTAVGVTEEKFIALDVEDAFALVLHGGDRTRVIGSREEVRSALHSYRGDHALTCMRVVLADAPTVDITRLRRLAGGLLACRDVSEVRSEILAAIGDR